MTVRQIFEQNTFPHRFYVRYAVACAKYAISFDKTPNKDSLKALALAERFGNGEDIPQKDLEAAAAKAAVAAVFTYGASAANAAICAANAATYTYAAPNTATYAYAAAVNATHASAEAACAESHCKDLLLNMIKAEYTELELMLLNIKTEAFNI